MAIVVRWSLGWLLLLWLGAMNFAVGQGVPVPELSDWVVDEAQVLTVEQQQALSQMLRQFEEQKGAQIFVLTIPQLDGEDIESYALRVFEQWKVGRASVDDGVLVLVAIEDRQMRIEVGYGLEGAVPDILAGRIIREQMAPAFQQQAYAQGLMAAATQLMQYIDAEELPTALSGEQDEDRPEGVESFIIVAILFVFSFLIPPVPAAVAVGIFIYTIFESLGWAIFAAMGAYLLSLFGSLWRFGPESDTRHVSHPKRRRYDHWGGGGGGFGGGGGLGGGGGASGGGGGSGGGGASGSW